MAPLGAAVFATLLMNDAYLPGAMVLGHSLKDKGAKAPLVCLVTVDKVSSETITELRTVYDDIIPVQQIVNKQPANLYVMNRPDLISTFTKIELWRQTQYSRIVYLDADMVALRAPNELLMLDTNFAAVPDIGWPDIFNSGMMVLNPNMGDYFSLLALAQRGISFDGADQGLLNMHFREWERLSFTYNCTPSGNYQYIPAYRHFQSSINMVHFIGRDKPWTLGRDNKFSSGVYGELLGMWWAVYDRHYRPLTQYYSGQHYSGPRTVQNFVHGEEPQYLGYSSTQPAAGPPTVEVTPPEGGKAEDVPVEQPMGDPPTPAEPSDFQPTPTVEQRRFSAPHTDWEPSRAPPPANSRPEASNFPTVTYDMSQDTSLFQPPAKYPDAPKDMWYQVPEKTQEPVKPIFPWESRSRKATRVFAQAKAPSPPPEPVLPQEPSTSLTDTTDLPTDSVPPPPPGASPDPWSTFQQRTNAWDDMPEIEQYVQAISQSRKGKLQVIHPTPSQASGPTDQKSTQADKTRRPSMKLTDFPTEVERPSLPVTPAPIRRPSFWGEERDDPGTFPIAEGVPKQEEWNPIAKLDELQRRQSELLVSPGASTALDGPKEPPKRDMPESMSKEAVIEATEKAMSPVKTPKPILKTPKFSTDEPEQSSSMTALPSSTIDPLAAT